MFKQVYRGKKVFVTGHTGFKGSWLAQWLLELGAEVTGFSDCVPTHPSLFEIAKLKDHLNDLRGDIRDADSLARAIKESKPDIIFHLAAQPLVRDSYENPKLTFDTNVGGTVNLLEAVRKTESVQAAVIVASDKCYENVEWEYGYREVDPLGGKDPYSASKGAAEIVFHSYVRSFFSNGSKRLGSARAGNVIGGHDWAKDRIIPDCFRAWESGKSVSIRSPHSTRPWQHVLEPLSGYLAQGAALLTNAPHMAGESFNFGPHSDANRSVLELLGEVKKFYPAASWKIESNDGEQKKEARLLRLVCDKAESRLNWSPTLSFSESIQFTVDGYLSQNSAGLNQIKKYSENARGRKISWAND